MFTAKRWDPAFTVKYNLTPSVNAYVRYATAYRAGGANVRSSQFRSYGAESVESWEVGLKSRFADNRVTLNIAAFSNRLKNAQVNVQEAPTTNPSLTETVNLPFAYTIKGVELETTIRAATGLTFSGSLAYMDAPKYFEIPNPLAAGNPKTRFYQVQTPEIQGNVAADYKTPDFGIGNLAFHADYSFASGTAATPGGLLVSTLGPNYKRPETKTNMLNGRISLQNVQMGGAVAELSVWGKNLLDDTNYTYGFDGAASGGGFAAFITPPRMFGVELRITY